MFLSKLRVSRRWLLEPYALLDEERARRGSATFRLRLIGLGRVLVTGDPALVREIAQRTDLDAGRGIRVLRTVLGERSLITLDGRDHAERRRLVGPLFRRNLDAMDRATESATREALAALPLGEPFSAYDLARRISLRTIVRFLLPGNPEQEARTAHLVESYLLSSTSPWPLFVRPLRLSLGRLTPWGLVRHHKKRLRRHLRERARAIRSAGHAEGGLAEIARHRPEISEEALVDEAVALLLFGHDTAASSLAWAFAHIWSHEGAVPRIRAEHEPYPYLMACLQESLRLCPTVVHVTRIAPRATRIGSWDVPAETWILPCAYLAQRDPEVFPEPEAFRPERFLQGRTYEGSWFPFGLGLRTCIGKHFALRQMHRVVGTCARHADFTLAPDHGLEPVRRQVLMVPRDGTRLVCTGLRHPV